MAEDGANSKTNSSVRLIVRITVGLVLAILLVLALMDRKAKSNATTTTTKWLDVLQTATNETKEIPHSELSQYIVGKPEITGEAVEGRVVYTWNGIFRSYTTTVSCGGNQIPVVERVEGPSS